MPVPGIIPAGTVYYLLPCPSFEHVLLPLANLVYC